MNFENKVAFITGAGGFIGTDNAKKLASLGAAVALCDVNEANIVRTAEEINAGGGKAIAVTADVTDSAQVDAAVQKAVDAFGKLDIMIHVAGGSARSRIKPLVEQSDDVIRWVLDVNLLGAFWASRAAARQMLRQGTGGHILCYSSIIGFNGGPGCADYAAAKAGISAMVKALAKEWGPNQININAIAPGIVMRPEENGGDARALDTNVFHRKCLPEDISSLAAYMVSDEASFITGQTYIIDGGRSLSLKGSD